MKKALAVMLMLAVAGSVSCQTGYVQNDDRMRPVGVTPVREPVNLGDPVGDARAAFARGDRRAVYGGLFRVLPGNITSSQSLLFRGTKTLTVDGWTWESQIKRSETYAADYNVELVRLIIAARPDFKAPKGLKNVAFKKPVTSSDTNPLLHSPDPRVQTLELITDGEKEDLDSHYVELASGKQWIQIDLQGEQEIFVVMLWHRPFGARSLCVYHDVVVQASNDPEMKKDVTTIFNNDHENSLGLGVGEGYQYPESYEGFLIPIKGGVKARYLRCWSNGNSKNDKNHYIEVEAWGKAAK